MSDNNKAPSVVKKIILARPAGVDVEENTRETAETLRVKAEMERVEAEDARAGAESGRVNAEEIRVASEKERVSAESARAASENLRETAEKERASAETERATEELTRQASEADRESAEAERKTAEATRIETETSRVSAEALRVSAEAKRETKWNNVSATAVTGEADADVVITDSGVVFNFTLPQGDKGNTGDMLWEEFNARLNPSGKNGQIAFESELPTSEQKSAWSAKYNKPTGGIPKTDLASSVQTSLGKADTALQEHQDISGKADATALTAHTGNSDIHVTATQKTAWNAKYDKPSGGIPKSDLASDIQTSLVPSSSSSDAGKTLTVNSSGMPAWADASPSGSSGADVFLVTFTKDEEIGNYTVDKTFAEVIAAYEAGKIVLGKLSDYVTFIGQLSIVSGGNGVCFTFNELLGSGRLLAFMLGANDKIMSISLPYYVPEFSQYTILTSGWSGGIYSFESDFPSATYDIEIELDSTATESQVEAWSSANVTAVFNTNTMKALGDVPTVDIPVIVKKVMK